MRAARVFDDLSLRIDDQDAPSAGLGEVLVRVRAAGVCGTDLHILDGLHKPDRYPMTLGHEAAGIVEATGEGVGLGVGTRVAIYNKLFCGTCEQCLAGRQNLCDRDQRQMGLNVDGNDADYVVIPEKNAVPVPDGLDLGVAAVLTCGGMTAVHASRIAKLRFGETAIVNGVGGVGVLIIQVARHAGARVIAVCDSDEKADLATNCGASEAIVISDPSRYEDLPTQIRSLTDGRGADVFFELVGTDLTMKAGVRALAKRGRFVSIGYTVEPLNIHPLDFILAEGSLLSSVAATRLDLELAVRLASSGRIAVPIAARYPLEAIHEALALLRERRVLGRQVLDL